MTVYKAMVKNRKTKELTIIESSYLTKKDFIQDLKSNGYQVNSSKVKTSEVFDYIINNTNCNKWDWEENN